jgi:hypothetical protein
MSTREFKGGAKWARNTLLAPLAAFSMRTTPGMPISWIVRRSISFISEALTNLIVPLKYHESHAVTAFIGKAQVKTGDLFFTADL